MCVTSSTNAHTMRLYTMQFQQVFRSYQNKWRVNILWNIIWNQAASMYRIFSHYIIYIFSHYPEYRKTRISVVSSNEKSLEYVNWIGLVVNIALIIKWKCIREFVLQDTLFLFKVLYLLLFAVIFLFWYTVFKCTDL